MRSSYLGTEVLQGLEASGGRGGFLEVVALGWVWGTEDSGKSKRGVNFTLRGSPYLDQSPPFLLGFREQFVMFYCCSATLWSPTSPPPARLLVGAMTPSPGQCRARSWSPIRAGCQVDGRVRAEISRGTREASGETPGIHQLQLHYYSVHNALCSDCIFSTMFGKMSF